MERSDHREAIRALEALWPSGRPSPRLTDAEVFELRAQWREVRLDEWRRALRRLADEGRRMRPHLAEIRHACKLEIRARQAPQPLPKLPPPPANREEALERVAQLRKQLAEMAKANGEAS